MSLASKLRVLGPPKGNVDMVRGTPTQENKAILRGTKTKLRESTIHAWKEIYEAFKIGEYWSKIGGYKGRSKCTADTCNDVTKTLDHILYKCPTGISATIWGLAEDMCKLNGIPWPKGMDSIMFLATPLVNLLNMA